LNSPGVAASGHSLANRPIAILGHRHARAVGADPSGGSLAKKHRRWNMRQFSWSVVCALVAAVGCSPAEPDDSQSDVVTGLSSAPKTLTKVYVTWYGFNDNSCQVETQHDCNTIAYPRSDGWNVPHDIATEGKGTYNDPVTFATSAKEIAVGTIIYSPEVRKYFVMEDSCFECENEWNRKHSPHVDLWMGPSYGSQDGPLTDCEDQLTLGDTYKGTGTIIVNPKSNMPVDTHSLFINNTCTAHTY
jgi:hypothetical protein